MDSVRTKLWRLLLKYDLESINQIQQQRRYWRIPIAELMMLTPVSLMTAQQYASRIQMMTVFVLIWNKTDRLVEIDCTTKFRLWRYIDILRSPHSKRRTPNVKAMFKQQQQQQKERVVLGFLKAIPPPTQILKTQPVMQKFLNNVRSHKPSPIKDENDPRILEAVQSILFDTNMFMWLKDWINQCYSLTLFSPSYRNVWKNNDDDDNDVFHSKLYCVRQFTVLI